MAQLIKLKDCISRYEWNAYRYPGQYIRLKQERWDKLYQLWNDRATITENELNDTKETSRFSKFKLFKWRESEEKDVVTTVDSLPSTEDGLKQYFLDEMFPFQIRWATSTVTDVSFTEMDYQYDANLNYFLQRFPDIYLLMYYPTFNIKQASVDSEIILISPIGIDIIYLMEDHHQATIIVGDDRTWKIEEGHTVKTIMSPMIALKRTEHIIKGILHTEQLDFPIQKLVLSRTNKILFSSEPYQTKVIGEHQYEEWFATKRQLNSTLKGDQLKVAEALLKYCLTTSTKRPEWEEEVNILSDDQGE